MVHFKVSNDICDEASAFMNMLCIRYPSVKFIKVFVNVHHLHCDPLLLPTIMIMLDDLEYLLIEI